MAGKIRSVNLYSLKGEARESIALPEAFATEYRPDIIKRAVVAQQANKRQPYGPSKKAGMRHSVSTWGKGRGVSRVQRLSQGRKGAESPNNVMGRRAHPPVPERDWSKAMNTKERRMAKLSALAASANEDIVRARGHCFEENVTLPVVFEDGFESLTSTKGVIEALDSVGLSDDLFRAKDGKHVRAGKGKMRGRRYRQPRSVLIVVSDQAQVGLGAKNIPGVEITCPRRLNTWLLAPGGDAGRLTVFSQSALQEIGEW